MPDLILDALPPPRRQRSLSALHRLSLEPVDATAPDSRPDPSRPIPRLVVEPIPLRFLGFAGITPDATAIQWHGGVITYGELELVSRRLALQLRRRGVGPGAVVGLLSDRNPALVAAMLAVLRLGATFSVLDAAYPVARLTKLAPEAGFSDRHSCLCQVRRPDEGSRRHRSAGRGDEDPRPPRDADRPRGHRPRPAPKATARLRPRRRLTHTPAVVAACLKVAARDRPTQPPISAHRRDLRVSFPVSPARSPSTTAV